MTEADWLASSDPAAMLSLLTDGNSAVTRAIWRPSGRQLRLFACVCARAVAERTGESRTIDAVSIAESYADAKATEWDLQAARYAIEHLAQELSGQAIPALIACELPLRLGALISPSLEVHWLASRAALIRDIFGNPWRRKPTLIETRPWRLWNDGTVRKLAQAIYDERAFDRMPILSDALEEAGCCNEEILSHGRSSDPHVRGCWLIDLLLGKS